MDIQKLTDERDDYKKRYIANQATIVNQQSIINNLREENKKLNYWYEGQCEISEKARNDKSKLEALYFKNKEEFNKIKQFNAKLIEFIKEIRPNFKNSDYDGITDILMKDIDKLLKEHKK